jgi:hypothetical protein
MSNPNAKFDCFVYHTLNCAFCKLNWYRDRTALGTQAHRNACGPYMFSMLEPATVCVGETTILL